MEINRTHKRIKRLNLIILIILISACKSTSSTEGSISAEEFKQLPKIDVHAHYKHSRNYLSDFFNRWNQKAILVDVAIETNDSIVRSFDNYVAHQRLLPNDFYLCTTFTAAGIEKSDYIERTIAQLKKDIEQGAVMVKVWKNFGMVTQDSEGNYIQINDPRLNPIWNFLVENNITVLAHIADPEQAWRPLLDPNNPHYNYYKNNPQYHAYNFPTMPSYEEIISARDQWIENNPELKIIGAHICSMSNNLDAVSERLEKYSNLSVELGARFGDLAMQDSEKVKLFFETYQDRILFGTDYGTGKPEDQFSAQDILEEEQDLEQRYKHLFNYLVREDSMVLRKQNTKGLGLSKTILSKIFNDNFLKFLENQTNPSN
jgi:predicted TIM-barrel fold metal-dependent hydrolase